MKWNPFKVIQTEPSPFKLIDKRMVMLKLVGVALSIISGVMMVAMVMLSDIDSEISRYTLVCQASNKMPNIGYVHAEVIRSFPLNLWLNSGGRNENKLVILKAEVNNENKYYAIADTDNDIPICLGELSGEYSPHILILPIEYEKRILLVGEVLECLGSNPPIFVQINYSIKVGDKIVSTNGMASVYGREFLLANFSGSKGYKLVSIDGLCVAVNSNRTGLYIYDSESCTNSQVSDIDLGLNMVIINDSYFNIE